MAINADSVASWFLPGVASVLTRHRLLLQIVIDDQDHTHDLLSGDVMGCVSTLAEPMRGCVAEPLGHDALPLHGRARGRATLPHAVRRGLAPPAAACPAVIFNRKDALQDSFLEYNRLLHQPRYPRHFAPAIDAFETAIRLGLGWAWCPNNTRRDFRAWSKCCRVRRST